MQSCFCACARVCLCVCTGNRKLAVMEVQDKRTDKGLSARGCQNNFEASVWDLGFGFRVRH